MIVGHNYSVLAALFSLNVQIQSEVWSSVLCCRCEFISTWVWAPAAEPPPTQSPTAAPGLRLPGSGPASGLPLLRGGGHHGGVLGRSSRLQHPRRRAPSRWDLPSPAGMQRRVGSNDKRLKHPNPGVFRNLAWQLEQIHSVFLVSFLIGLSPSSQASLVLLSTARG